jgi:hypothetical protein
MHNLRTAQGQIFEFQDFVDRFLGSHLTYERQPGNVVPQARLKSSTGGPRLFFIRIARKTPL